MKWPWTKEEPVEVPADITQLKGYNPASNGVRLLPKQEIYINGHHIKNDGEGIIYWGEHK